MPDQTNAMQIFPRISPAQVRERLAARDEFALLDVREQGVHYRGHPFFACPLPLSRLELLAPDLLPRKDVQLVLLDDGDELLAQRAAQRFASLGYSQIAILAGGCQGWAADGGELFSGVNVPSKAFGEFVEHHYDTPRVPPEQIEQMRRDGRKMVILDSRPFDEYHRMNIPDGVDVPGAELVWRVHDIAPDPDTLVVVNCAGRTRSIIGCQSLRNAGIANEVVALKDGTMGWELAGLQVERGSSRVAGAPSARGVQQAQEAAQRVAQRFKVHFASSDQVRAWQQDTTRTLYLLDVRTREEFETKHLAGSRHAPGGQLVQATDEYVAVRGARIVLIDPAGVRSVMTASWLNQMGLDEVFVLEPTPGHDFSGWACEQGPRQAVLPELAGSELIDVQTIDAQTLAGRLHEEGLLIIDLATSLRFRARHLPGAWWAVRARLDQAAARQPSAQTLVLTADDERLARLAVADARLHWPAARVLVLNGGNAGWFAAGLPVETGIDRATTSLDDVWYKPYDQAQDYEKHARDYLSWEVALVEQIRKDPSIRFRAYD